MAESLILSLYGKICALENSYSCIFYTVLELGSTVFTGKTFVANIFPVGIVAIPPRYNLNVVTKILNLDIQDCGF